MAATRAVRRWLRGIRWYARQLSGESKWDDYLERCRREGREPISRRAFERHRADAAEHSCTQRCC